jgi:hypothetical protein
MGWSLPAVAQIYDPYSDAIGVGQTDEVLPAVAVERAVSAGEPIVLTKWKRTSEGASLDVEAVAKNGNLLHAGTLLYRIETSRAFKACTVRQDDTGTSDCFIDDDGDGTFDRAARGSIGGAKEMAAPARYNRLTTVDLPAGGNGFERRILYQGAEGGNLKLSYREFSNDIARLPFSEELSIPLTANFPQQFAAKGLIFTVFSIDGLGLKYQLDKVGEESGWGSEFRLEADGG